MLDDICNELKTKKEQIKYNDSPNEKEKKVYETANDNGNIENKCKLEIKRLQKFHKKTEKPKNLKLWK